MRGEKVRCSGTMTEAGFFSWVVSHLRGLSKLWKPRDDYLKSVRRVYQGKDKRIKFEYPCMKCGKWFVRKEIQADHTVPCGVFRTFSDAPGWLERYFVEKDGWTSLCKPCHRIKTNEEARERRASSKKHTD